MIKFFRHIRKELMEQNKTSPNNSVGRAGKYFKYAIGEIVLVVIGILIALQINNWNDQRLERTQEIKFLKNIKADLNKDLIKLDNQLAIRKEKYKGTTKLISQINGAPITDLDELTYNVVNSLMEWRFTPNNGTYNELNSSGNLNIISNDSIKSLIMELQELYKTNTFAIEHETFDYQEYISKPFNKHLTLQLLFPVYNGDKTVEEQGLSIETYSELFESAEYNNGLYIINLISYEYLSLYENIKTTSEKVINLIDQEINKNGSYD